MDALGAVAETVSGPCPHGEETALFPFRPAQRPSDHDLTVIVPAFNEAERLPRTLRTLREVMDHWEIDWRVLVVDDGSRDDTYRCTESMDGRFSTLRLRRQSGKGAAVRAGMLSAAGRIVSFTDADLPFDLEALRAGYQRIAFDGCEVVFGARDVAESRSDVRRRWSRVVASYLFRQLVRRLVSTKVTDTQCGLKLFHRGAAQQIFSRTVIDGFAFDAEVAMLAANLGYHVSCIPVTLVNDYASTLSLRRHALPMLADVLRVRARHLLGRYDRHQTETEPSSNTIPLASRQRVA